MNYYKIAKSIAFEKLHQTLDIINKRVNIAFVSGKVPAAAPLIFNIDIKTKHEQCQPRRKHAGDAAFDFFCSERTTCPPNSAVVVPLGVYFDMKSNPNLFLLTCEPSSNYKNTMKNLIKRGDVVDSGYTGEFCALFTNVSDQQVVIEQFDRVLSGVFMFVPNVEVNINGQKYIEATSERHEDGGFKREGVTSGN